MAELAAKRAWVIAWVNDGETISRVARAARVSRNTVRAWCRRAGVDMREAKRKQDERLAETIEKLKAEGLTMEQIGEKLGIKAGVG